MITLSKSDYEKILDYSNKWLPSEACGLLGGEFKENGDKIVNSF